jgi:replicative DNA helicase
MFEGTRIPPCNLEAESAILSAILTESEMTASFSKAISNGLDEAMSILKPEHFYSDPNRRVYEACLGLESIGTSVDVVSVDGWLRSHGRADVCQDGEYLKKLAWEVPASLHLGECAKLIRESWRLRQLIGTCQKIAAEGYLPQENPQRFIDAAEQAIYEISSDRHGKGPERIKSIVQSTFEEMQEHASSPEPEFGVRSGLRELDRILIGLHPGDLCVIAARPGNGKTTIGVNQFACDTAEHGRAVAVFSLEMLREQLSRRLVFSMARVDSNTEAQRRLKKEDWDRLTESAVYVSKLPLYIEDESGMTLPAIRASSRRIASMAQRDGSKLGLIVVDYLQLMESDRKRESREAEVAANSRGLKHLAKEMGVPVIVLSQLNRAVETRGKKAKPQMSDLRESGAIEQDADQIVFIHVGHEKSDEGLAELIVAKGRHHGTGSCYVAWQKQYTRFDDLAEGYQVDSDDAY